MTHPADLTIERAAREKCGVFAAWGAPEPARLAYFALTALQHRGQESAGIATTDGASIELHVDMGLVANVFAPQDLAKLDTHACNRCPSPSKGWGGAIAHNRYSTTGDSAKRNAQPFVSHLKGGQVAVAHNGNIANASALRAVLENDGHAFHTTSDTEIVLQMIAAAPQSGTESDPLAHALALLKGAFSMAFLSKDKVECARDPWGWRPLALGELPDGSPVVASETVALDVIGATFIREIEPGEIVTLSDEGVSSRFFADPAPRRAHCIFEHVYFASPASTIYGQNVQIVREKLGEILCAEAPADADIVVPMPDSGRSAASGYARASAIPYREAIIPNRYVGRTFIKPTAEQRTAAVRMKLNIIADIVRGQRVIVVDDSIVRGTTTRTKMDQLRAAGAKEIHLRIASPPIRHACFFGVDFPDPSHLIANRREIDQVREMLAVDSLHYISLDGLLDACASDHTPREHFCTACYSGDYRIDIDPATNKEVFQSYHHQS